MPVQQYAPGTACEEVRFLQHRESGLRAVLAIHSTRLGPAFGGIRRTVYPNARAAEADAERLAEAMSLKCAIGGLPAGGGKLVVLDHPELDAAGAYAALGRAVEKMAGRFVCGPDVGTGEDGLSFVRQHTRYVNPEGNDAAAATAAGVLAGIEGALRVLDGEAQWQGRRFAVQGLGSVGARVAQGLRQRGGTVVGSDTDPQRAEQARQSGIQVVAPESILEEDCDVLSPCALGGVLDQDTAARLSASVVCGSANNQLGDDLVAGDLHARGVLYVPDFTVNWGGVAEGVFTVREGATATARQKALRHVQATVPETVEEVLRRSLAEDRPSQEIALETAQARLA